MGYQGNYPPSTPLNPTQLGTGVVTTDAIANGAVIPADLSTGGPYWNTSGQVGIGTTSPSYTIHLVSTTNPSVFAQNSTSGVAAFFGTSGSGVAQFGSTNSGVRFLSNNAETMRIDSSGNVGIGTSSPAQKLDVGGGSGLIVNRINGGATNSSDGSATYYTNAGTLSLAVGNYSAINGGAYSNQPLVYGAIGNLLIQSAGALIYNTSGANERMRIDSSGNVGIGTSSPNTRLSVFTSGNTNTLQLMNNAALDTGGYINSTGNAELMISGGASYNSYSAPNFVMNAKSTIASGMYLTGDTIRFWVNTGLTAGTTFNQTERMRIDSSGNLLVGTTSSIGSSAALLQISGYNGSGGTGYFGFLNIQNTYGSATNPKKFFRLNSSGSIEIINDAYNAIIYTFDNSGNFTANGNVTAYSDARLKKDVSTIDNALDLVEKMRGVRYTRIDSEAKGVGVIAQEIQEVLPEVVMEGENLSVAYGNIVGVLIEAIKELNAKIAVLEAK